ncbi:MAG: ABC transporter substrate-binding protein [Nocardioidaceae bacterium]
MMSTRRRQIAVVAVTGAAMSLTACGSGGEESTQQAAQVEQFKEHGPITYVAGKDSTGTIQGQIDVWNKDHPDEKVTFVELPEDADAQRQQMIQNAETQSGAFTVLSLDVVWTSEFAANQWVEPLPQSEFPMDDYLQPAVQTGIYRGKMYAAPWNSDGGMLYYRTDLLEQAGIDGPPSTWAEMEADCAKVLKLPEAKGMSCYAGQFDKYEGLTVNFSEAVNAAGGTVTDEQGNPHVDTPEAQKGLDTLVQGFESGTIPDEALTFQEEEGRLAFQEGKLVFHRQWPYQYELANATDGSSKVAGKFDVAPLPGISSDQGVSSLGGHNMAISSYAKNKGTALDFIKYMSSEEQQRKQLSLNSLAPTIESIYDDPAMVKKFPFLPTLQESIATAEPRPKFVEYGDATAAIQEAAYGAISGDMSSDEALQQLQGQLSGMR